MLVTEALCRKTGKTLDTLVKESQRAICLSKTYMPKKKKQKPSTDGKDGEKVAKPTQNQPPKAKKPSQKPVKKHYKPNSKKKDTKIKEN